MVLQNAREVVEEPDGEEHEGGELPERAEQPQRVDADVLRDLLRVDRHDGEAGRGGESSREAHLPLNIVVGGESLQFSTDF